MFSGVTLGEEHKLKVFENRVLRRISGPKRDEIIGGWRECHDEELQNLYSSPNIIRMFKSRRMGWTGRVAGMGRRGIHVVVGGEQSERKRPLGII
jgi:hypothetical protein